MGDLTKAAAAEAQTHEAESWAAVEPACKQSAVEFLADYYLHHPEDPAKTVFQVEAKYCDPEAVAVLGPPADLFSTEVGHQLEERLALGWMTAAAEHLLSVKGTGSLLAWAEQERHRLRLDSLAAAILADDPSTLGLADLWREKAWQTIGDLGKMTVGQVLAADNGAAALRMKSEGLKQSRMDRARNEQSAQARRFYNENVARFLLAAGLEDRLLHMENLDAVRQAVRALGWTRHEQAMFADGAPRKAMSNSIRGLMRQRSLGSVPTPSKPTAPAS